MSLETELAQFVKSRPAFWSPIATNLGVTSSPTPPVDTGILSRICYGEAPQTANPGHYIVWTGPKNYDPGLVSEGAIGNKTARFWFTVYSEFLDDATDWMNAIESDIINLFVPGYYFDLTSVRIMSMLQVAGTKYKAEDDMVQRTGDEFQLTGFTCCWQICWQSRTVASQQIG